MMSSWMMQGTDLDMVANCRIWQISGVEDIGISSYSPRLSRLVDAMDEPSTIIEIEFGYKRISAIDFWILLI